MKVLSVAVALLFAVGCSGGEGGGNNITGPSNSIPSVAGNYSGTTTMAFPELNTTVRCPTTTSVTQNGRNISVAPLVLGGECGGMSIPLGPTTIDATGSLGQDTGSLRESCGTYNYQASGGFFGRDMRMSINATSLTCYNFNMTITVSR